MMKSAGENWCGLNKNGETQSARIDTQKYVKYVTHPVQIVSFT